ADDKAIDAIEKLMDQLRSEAKEAQLPVQKVLTSVRAVNVLKDIDVDIYGILAHSIDPSVSAGPRSPLDIVSQDKIWPKIIQVAALGTVDTDADGKYAVNVQPG